MLDSNASRTANPTFRGHPVQSGTTHPGQQAVVLVMPQNGFKPLHKEEE